MGIFKSTKKAAGKIIDVRVDKWISWDYLSETAGQFKVLLLDIVVPKKASYSETFEEAMQRLQLNEEDLVARKKEFTRLFYFFLGLAFLVVLYALYMAIKGSLAPSLIAFCLALYALTQAFRFHFWLFQIKHRKLGCSWREWFNSQAYHPPKKEMAISEIDSLSNNSHQQKGE